MFFLIGVVVAGCGSSVEDRGVESQRTNPSFAEPSKPQATQGGRRRAHAAAGYLDRLKELVDTTEVRGLQKLLATDGARGDGFGESISVAGRVLVIGSIGRHLSPGAAYIFERGSDGQWNQRQKLTQDDGAAHDEFGLSVSVSGDVVVVGAHWDDDKGKSSGSAYVFERDSSGRWRQQQKLTASNGTAHDSFGFSVSVSGDVAVIGAHHDDTNRGENSGSAYVFVRDPNGRWSQRRKLMAADGAKGDLFGNSVSVSGDVAVVGARWDDDKGKNSGSAYVFVRGSDGRWSQRQQLTPTDGAGGDNLGFSVSVSSDVIVVGAPSDDDKGDASGSAYVLSVP
ncbi:MAG: FG-GAP repeat protein [Candidatus Latescibacteria bacterium]|nr:FG-GAP repeat protein [Candidatus Latescibacterota bacterium]